MAADVMRLAEFGGINLADHPRDIADNEFARAENIYPLSPSTLALRKGSTRLAGLAVDGANSGQGDALALAGYNHSNGQRFIYALMSGVGAWENSVFVRHVRQDESQWGGTYRQAVQFRPYNPAWAIWLDRLYLLSGLGELDEFSGEVATLGGLLTVGPTEIRPSVLATYRNRMLYGGDRTNPSFLFFSDPNSPRTLAANQWVPVGQGDGGKITAIVVAGTTGGDSPAESQVVILKDRQTWLFRGDLPVAGPNAGAASLHLISREAGCSNHRTVAVTPQGLMWAGYETVYLMPSVGAVPIAVGDKVGPILNTISGAQRHLMRAVYYDGFYRLLYDQGNSTRGSNQLWADLRTPGKVTWWGPMATQYLADFYADHRPGLGSRLLGIAPPSSLGGRLYLLDASQHYEAMLDEISAGTGTVLPVLRTKEYDFGDGTLRKIIEGAELNVFTDRNRDVRCSFLLEGGSTRRQVTVAVNAGGPFALGTSVLGGIIGERPSLVNFQTGAGGRLVGRTLQLLFEAVNLGTDTDVGTFQIQEIMLRLRRIARRAA